MDERTDAGDPVCWLHLACPECGAVIDGPRCWRCGAARPAAPANPDEPTGPARPGPGRAES